MNHSRLPAAALAAALLIGGATIAQEAPATPTPTPDATQTAVDIEDDDDGFDMGWLGLLGLIGLAGLARRGRRDDHRTTTTSSRP